MKITEINTGSVPEVKLDFYWSKLKNDTRAQDSLADVGLDPHTTKSYGELNQWEKDTFKKWLMQHIWKLQRRGDKLDQEHIQRELVHLNQKIGVGEASGLAPAETWYQGVKELDIMKERFAGQDFSSMSSKDKAAVHDEFMQALQRVKQSAMPLQQFAVLIGADPRVIEQLANGVKLAESGPSRAQHNELDQAMQDIRTHGAEPDVILNHIRVLGHNYLPTAVMRELKKLIEPKRKDFVEVMLAALALDFGYEKEEIADLIVLLEECEINWSELDAMRNSLQADGIMESSTQDGVASELTAELIKTGQAVDLMQRYGVKKLVQAIDSVSAANYKVGTLKPADMTRLIGQVNKIVTGSEVTEDDRDDPNQSTNPAQSPPANAIASRPTQPTAATKPAVGTLQITKQNQNKTIPAAQLASMQKQGWAVAGQDPDKIQESWQKDLLGLAAAAGLAAGAWAGADSNIKDTQTVAGQDVKHFRGVLNVDAKPLGGYHTSFYGKPAVVWTGKTKKGEELVFWNYTEDGNAPSDKDLNLVTKKQKTATAVPMPPQRPGVPLPPERDTEYKGHAQDLEKWRTAVKESPIMGDRIMFELADGRAFEASVAEVRGNSVIVDLDEVASAWLDESPTIGQLKIGEYSGIALSHAAAQWNSMVDELAHDTPEGWASVMASQGQHPDRWKKIWRQQHEKLGTTLTKADVDDWVQNTEAALAHLHEADDAVPADGGAIKLRKKLDDKDDAMLAVWMQSQAAKRSMTAKHMSHAVAKKVGHHPGTYWARISDYIEEGDVPPGRQMTLADPDKPWGLANPRIIWVGDDPQGVRPYKTRSFDPLSIGTFSQWNNEQHHARNKGYQLRYIGMDKNKRRESQWMGEDPVSPRVLADRPKPEPKYKDNVIPFKIKTDEAEYQGRSVQLGKPIRTNTGEGGKFKVYVRDPKTGNIKMVRFGDTTGLSIKRDDPKRRKSFRARHHCDNPGPRTKARYWSCRMWTRKPVSKVLKGK
jgi:hypothetical protein